MDPVRYAGLSDTGRRPRNDDRWGADPAHGLYMVADGVATTTGGGLAASMVIELLPACLPHHLTPPGVAGRDASALLGKALAQVSDDLHTRGQSDPRIAGAGTTTVAAIVTTSLAVVAHLGDSRAFLYRDQTLQQLTRDHTLIQTLIDEHGLSADADVTRNPARGVLTRYVMMPPPAQPDVAALDLRPGDRILLSTDGLHGVVGDTALAAVLAAEPTPTEACRALIDAANRAGGRDNITAVVIDLPA